MGKSNTDFVPGQGYTLEDWLDVSDNPELTAADFAKAKPFAEVFPDLAESITKESITKNGVTVQRSKGQISVLLSSSVVEKYQAGGAGWQARIEADLRRLNNIK